MYSAARKFQTVKPVTQCTYIVASIMESLGIARDLVVSFKSTRKTLSKAKGCSLLFMYDRSVAVKQLEI